MDALALLAGEVVTAPIAVRVRAAHKGFAGRSVLRGFELELHATEFVALLGKSGSGKSTLLRALANLESLDGGSIEVPARRSMVFQEPRLIENLRVRDNVILGLPRTRKTLAAADAVLAEVELESHARAWPSTLSGGEAARVALARALLRDPQLLLLDEPFAALDALTRIKMHQLVAALRERHPSAALLVTHDVDEALLLADRVVVLSDGAVSVDLSVPLTRPRLRTQPEFGELRRRLLSALGVVET